MRKTVIMDKIRVGLVGITGYTGMELARLLASHPHMELTMGCSRSEAGRRLGEFYPFLEGLPGADVIITVTNANATLVEEPWVKTGGLVIGNIVSSRTQEHREDIILRMKCANLWNMRLRSTLRLFLK